MAEAHHSKLLDQVANRVCIRAQVCVHLFPNVVVDVGDLLGPATSGDALTIGTGGQHLRLKPASLSLCQFRSPRHLDLMICRVRPIHRRRLRQHVWGEDLEIVLNAPKRQTGDNLLCFGFALRASREGEIVPSPSTFRIYRGRVSVRQWRARGIPISRPWQGSRAFCPSSRNRGWSASCRAPPFAPCMPPPTASAREANAQ